MRVGLGIAAFGFLLWFVGIAADSIGLGGQPGYNWKQILVAELGLLAMLFGVLAARATGWRRPRRPRWRGPSVLRPWLKTPEGAVAGVVLFFIALTAWWLTQDARVPNGDSGRHLVLAYSYLDTLRNGTLTLLANPTVIDNEFYPPAGHLVGAFGSLVAGFSPTAAIFTENLVFVPLLAIGCYGVGRQVFDRCAGALAAVFALSVPILVSQWHVFQLDAPQTAMVAVGAWLLLASDRFGHAGHAALAGLTVGIATMIKVTTPLFLAGLVLVILIRGGWRNWRGVAVFGLCVLLISQPWLLATKDLLTERTTRAVGGAAGAPAPSNYESYLTGAFSVQYYLPLCAFFVVGTVVSTWSWLRSRRPDLLPELLLGVAAAYLLVGGTRFFDNRYIMPALVFLAVLGTGWIVSLQRPARTALTGALVLVFALNTIMISTGLGRDVAVDIPGISERVVLVSDVGYIEAKPEASLGYRELLARASEQGARNVLFEGPSLNTGGTNLNGLAALAFSEGLTVLPEFEAASMGSRDIFVLRRTLGEGAGRPCVRLAARQAVYVYRGGPPGADNSYCP